MSSAPRADVPRVALVHDWLTGMRGGEKVLEQIAAALPTAPIYTLFHFPGSVSAELSAHPIHTSWLQHLPGVQRHYRTLLPLFPAAIERFDLSSYELVISTSHCVAKGVRVPAGTHLCYCHTPVRYAWDQRRTYFPDDGPVVRRLRDRALDRLQLWDRRTASRVDHYAANSTFVQQRIRSFWDRDAEVVHPPVDTEAVQRAAREPTGAGAKATTGDSPFLLSVAALSPYKRHDIAIRAALRTNQRLVIVGDGPQRRELQKLADSLQQASSAASEQRGGPGVGRVEFRGRVDDAELRTLLHRAAAFVQPGIEDFGIAAVEALAAGTPVVAAGQGGVTDIVVHGEHGFLYPAGDGCDEIEGLVEALERLRERPLAAAKLRARAEEFSIARFHARWRAFLESRLEPDLFRRLALCG